MSALPIHGEIENVPLAVVTLGESQIEPLIADEMFTACPLAKFTR